MKADGWGGLGGPVRTVASFWGAARAVGEMRSAHPIQVFYALRLGSLAAQEWLELHVFKAFVVRAD
ncbi:conserved hypothetical protein [Xanthomonas citri pv. fuscans]|uniref:Uncharacterized protein n=1 Tax=Xanthomonas campestris pv. phaseoli TaxID=317013 RepID=A0A7Z7NGV7_XANCH|nr:conserved hypothetical protein [Xanthomonas citri pv. fuscans]SOO23056.1 conserved hypothetical protein [Xanthomonas phaseoli pv. phaseoli]